MARPLRERESDAGISGITAPATATLKYDAPAIQTYSGANQQWGQVAAPSPYSNMATPGSNQTWNAPTNSWQGAPAQASPQTFAPSPPPPPPAPPVGGRTWYNGLDQGAKAAQDQSWLGGDSDYTAQIAEYDKALRTFIDRIANQKKGFEQDANDATASTNRNQGLTLDQLGEDFGARGLSYSGLAVDSADKTNTRFNEAKGQIGKVLARNNQEADNRQADYQTENDISRLNAQKSSLSRQAQRQALLDSMAGF